MIQFYLFLFKLLKKYHVEIKEINLHVTNESERSTYEKETVFYHQFDPDIDRMFKKTRPPSNANTATCYTSGNRYIYQAYCKEVYG